MRYSDFKVLQKEMENKTNFDSAHLLNSWYIKLKFVIGGAHLKEDCTVNFFASSIELQMSEVFAFLVNYTSLSHIPGFFGCTTHNSTCVLM